MRPRQIDQRRSLCDLAVQRQPDLRQQLDVAPLAVDLPVVVDRDELVGQRAGRLARAEEQHAARRQPEVEQRHHGALRLGLEVDQEVAARDEVHLRERRVLGDVVAREHDHLAQVVRDLVAARPLGEEPLEPARADELQLHLAVDPGAGVLERRLVDVGRQHLEPDLAVARREALAEQHRQRVRLLAGRAARDPDPELLVGRQLVDQRRDHLGLEPLERLRIAEELGDADQQVLVQRVELVGIAAQVVDVRGQALGAHQVGPALDPPPDRGGLVQREVDAEVVAQVAQQRVHRGVVGQRLVLGHDLARREAAQHAREVARRVAVVDRAGRRRRQRHAVELGAGGGLGEHQPAGALDLDHAARAVAAAARQHDRDGLLADVLRQRAEERVDRQGERLRLLVGEHQVPVADDHLLARRHQVDVVGAHRHVVFRDHDGHLAVARDQLVHQAAEVRRQVLDDHECHAGVGRQRIEQLLEGFEATR